MPFKSRSQQKYLEAHPEKLGQAKLKEFENATAAQPGGFAALPEKAPKKRKKK